MSSGQFVVAAVFIEAIALLSLKLLAFLFIPVCPFAISVSLFDLSLALSLFSCALSGAHRFA